MDKITNVKEAENRMWLEFGKLVGSNRIIAVGMHEKSVQDDVNENIAKWADDFVERQSQFEDTLEEYFKKQLLSLGWEVKPEVNLTRCIIEITRMAQECITNGMKEITMDIVMQNAENWADEFEVNYGNAEDYETELEKYLMVKFKELEEDDIMLPIDIGIAKLLQGECTIYVMRDGEKPLFTWEEIEKCNKIGEQLYVKKIEFSVWNTNTDLYRNLILPKESRKMFYAIQLEDGYVCWPVKFYEGRFILSDLDKTEDFSMDQVVAWQRLTDKELHKHITFRIKDMIKLILAENDMAKGGSNIERITGIYALCKSDIIKHPNIVETLKTDADIRKFIMQNVLWKIY